MQNQLDRCSSKELMQGVLSTHTSVLKVTLHRHLLNLLNMVRNSWHVKL